MGKPFSVERSITITAPSSEIYPHIVDLKNWVAWSPWEELDPNMEHVYAGSDGAVGQSMAWKGNRKAGAGKMTITEVDPSEFVGLDLEFVKPFKAQNTVNIFLTPKGDSTVIRWLMRGEQNLLMRLMDKVMSMDKMVGNDFEKGLNNLKGVVVANG